MNFDSYRRAMDENKLSDEKKAALMGYAEATPLRGSPKFEKMKRRKKAKIASLASLAACFTLICVAGAPLLFFGIFWRAGSSAPEESLPTSAEPPWYLADKDSSHNLIATEALPDSYTATGATLATAASNGANSGVSGYQDIYMLMQSNHNPTEDSPNSSDRTEDEAETTPETEDNTPLPTIVTQTFSASASDSSVTIKNSLDEEKVLVYGETTKILALYAYENCLIVCSEVEKETVAFVYALTDAGVPQLLGDLSVSGNMLDASVDGNILTVTTEFTPSIGDETDYAAYIPQYAANGKTWLVAAEDCIVTNSSSGKYTCFVVIEIELAEEPTIISVKAEFTEKSSAGANKK